MHNTRGTLCLPGHVCNIQWHSLMLNANARSITSMQSVHRSTIYKAHYPGDRKDTTTTPNWAQPPCCQALLSSCLPALTQTLFRSSTSMLHHKVPAHPEARQARKPPPHLSNAEGHARGFTAERLGQCCLLQGQIPARVVWPEP